MAESDNPDGVSASGRAAAPHPFFDAFRYPWHRREAVDLHRGLYQAIGHPSRIDLYYQQSCAELPPLNIRQAADLIWRDALEQLTSSGCLRRFCHLIAEEQTLAAVHPLVDAVVNATHSATDARVMVRTGLAHENVAALDSEEIERLLLRALRDRGLPPRVLEYLPVLIDQAFDFYSCFISYSTLDQEFAARLYSDLQSNGVRCWFAPHDIMPGRKLHEQIDEAIRRYDRLLLILSDHSMSSEWVRTEIANAREREVRERRQVLFPISIVPYEQVRQWRAFDADTGKDSAREIREYFIPDFSQWTDRDAYQTTFERLLKGLKTQHR